jgi:hypothetical protein
MEPQSFYSTIFPDLLIISGNTSFEILFMSKTKLSYLLMMSGTVCRTRLPYLLMMSETICRASLHEQNQVTISSHDD